MAQWQRSGEIRREIVLDQFIVMPNHVHGIVWLNADADPLNDRIGHSANPLARFLGALKGAVTREATRQAMCTRPIWQRNYYERKVRNETDLDDLREYVIANPIRWRLGLTRMPTRSRSGGMIWHMSVRFGRLVVAVAMIGGTLVVGHAQRAVAPATPAHDYPVKPIPFTAVQLTISSGRPASRSIAPSPSRSPSGKNEETGRVNNFVRAATVLKGQPLADRKPPGHPFDDTDIYKVLEGAAYTLSVTPDPRLSSYLDELIAKIAAAQEKDGYLYTTRTSDPQHPHRVTFTPVVTSALRLGITLQPQFSAGILEWAVDASR